MEPEFITVMDAQTVANAIQLFQDDDADEYFLVLALTRPDTTDPRELLIASVEESPSSDPAYQLVHARTHGGRAVHIYVPRLHRETQHAKVALG